MPDFNLPALSPEEAAEHMPRILELHEATVRLSLQLAALKDDVKAVRESLAEAEGKLSAYLIGLHPTPLFDGKGGMA